MDNKTIMRYHLSSVTMVIKKKDNVAEDCGEIETLIHCW